MSNNLLHVKIPCLSSLYIEDGRLPDVGRDYTHITRPRRHLWSQEEKQILYILNHHYENNPGELWKVFITFFADRFKRLPKPRRRSWESMRNHNAHASRYRVWWTWPTTKRLQARLEQTAFGIGINLRAVARHHVEVLTLSSRKRRYTPSPSDTPDSSDLDWDSDQLETDNEVVRRACVIGRPYDTSQTPRPRAQEAKKENGLLTPPSTRKPNRQVPPIAFRAFNPQSQGLNSIDGFVAGSFIGTDLPMIPGPPDEDIYLRDLERHLGRKHSGATPLISVSQNLLRVLVHALRRSRQAGKEGKNEWSIAVISLSRISSSIRAVWNLDAGVHSRRAFGEWVVYGAIPSSNVLCVLSVDKLLLLLSQVPAPFHVDVIKKAKSTRSARKAMATAVNRRLTHGDGVMFGCLLLSLGIPKRYIEYVCTTILADWRFPEHETWLSNKDFVQGLSEAYQRKPRGFTSIAATIEQDRNSRGARPMYNANATVSDPIYDHEWLPSFLTEVEQAAFGAKQTDYITPAHQHEPMAKAESYHESGWKMESPDYVVLDATPVHFKSKPTEF